LLAELRVRALAARRCRRHCISRQPSSA